MSAEVSQEGVVSPAPPPPVAAGDEESAETGSISEVVSGIWQDQAGIIEGMPAPDGLPTESGAETAEKPPGEAKVAEKEPEKVETAEKEEDLPEYRIPIALTGLDAKTVRKVMHWMETADHRSSFAALSRKRQANNERERALEIERARFSDEKAKLDAAERQFMAKLTEAKRDPGAWMKLGGWDHDGYMHWKLHGGEIPPERLHGEVSGEVASLKRQIDELREERRRESEQMEAQRHLGAARARVTEDVAGRLGNGSFRLLQKMGTERAAQWAWDTVVANVEATGKVLDTGAVLVYLERELEKQREFYFPASQDAPEQNGSVRSENSGQSNGNGARKPPVTISNVDTAERASAVDLTDEELMERSIRMLRGR